LKKIYGNVFVAAQPQINETVNRKFMNVEGLLHMLPSLYLRPLLNFHLSSSAQIA